MKFNTAMDKEKTRTIALEYNTGATLAEKAEMFGEQVVNELADDSMVITIQANVRRLMRAGKSDAEIQDWLSTYKPGTRGPRVSATTPDKILAAFSKMAPEQRAALLAALSK